MSSLEDRRNAITQIDPLETPADRRLREKALEPQRRAVSSAAMGELLGGVQGFTQRPMVDLLVRAIPLAISAGAVVAAIIALYNVSG